MENISNEETDTINEETEIMNDKQAMMNMLLSNLPDIFNFQVLKEIFDSFLYNFNKTALIDDSISAADTYFEHNNLYWKGKMRKVLSTCQRKHWDTPRFIPFINLIIPNDQCFISPCCQGDLCMLVLHPYSNILDFIQYIVTKLQEGNCREINNLNLQNIDNDELFRRIEIHSYGLKQQFKIYFWSEDETSCLSIEFKS